MDFYQIIKKPLITEKATKQKEQANQLTFEVDRRANKILVRNAVENIFKVKVLSVTVTNVKGKKRTVGRNVGRKPDWKKAIVRLAPGENIEFFEGV
ncbi:MAG: 50S ribosomal protein L23 [Deltaproteobacteria bacterium]|nr:50S ribosomal protein L23 [Deltaproteobacteria bacterium]OQY16350.1 MAG: 50S ribosomal protein L23 [Desulfobacterium sp. 4572_20]HDH88049.1 50S ribosomal protein L23 [Desulfobacteraceae bacterium]MBW2105092.1 50S ribosomal protein L23 [Deltaproteobacteria bacterium]MBW2332740.1 50S ribosomal protein L23 [Deltaproteobacteria bacterium]